MPRFADIKLFPRAHYQIDVEWSDLEDHVADCVRQGLDLDPDYQRAHVWTPQQRSAYIEYMLRGGEVSRTVYVNAPRWDADLYAGATLVDGKQRLEAVRAWQRGEVLAFGHPIGDYEGRPRFFCGRLHWCVVTLPTRAEVLELYLSINAGGTPHRPEEIARVRAMLAAERGESPIAAEVRRESGGCAECPSPLKHTTVRCPHCGHMVAPSALIEAAREGVRRALSTTRGR